MLDNLDLEDLHERVETDLARQKTMTRWLMMAMSALFVFGFFVIGMGILATGDWSGGVLIGLGGMMALVFQFMASLMDSGRLNTQMREQALARALSREISAQSLQHRKRKREIQHRLTDDEERIAQVRLSDDGELIQPYQQK